MSEELLQDLEELCEGDEAVDDEDQESDYQDEEHNLNEEPKNDLSNYLLLKPGQIDDISSIAKLQSSKLYKTTLSKIDKYFKDREFNIEENDSEDHKLVVQTNNLAAEIDNEIITVYKFIKAIYSKRFPELDSLVTNPLEYFKAVTLIGNDLEINEAKLKEFLPPAAVMVITVSSTTTEGKRLSEDEFEKVVKVCDLLRELELSKRKVFSFIEFRMSTIAPNLSALLNSNISANLVGMAGGLPALVKIPASDILVLGRSKTPQLGFTLSGNVNHRGLIYFSDLITSVPENYKRKAARALAGKVCLAARIDICKSCPDGSMGRMYRDNIQKHIELILQPPVIKAVKALPVPEDGPRRRRAGRRFRSLKQRTQLNELSKAQNRMPFGVQETEVGFYQGETKGLGILGTQMGKIRSYQADTRFKMSMSKKHKILNNAIANSSGFSSSVAFTPVKGIELENPYLQAKRKQTSIESKLFSSTVFSKVLAQKKLNESASLLPPEKK